MKGDRAIFGIARLLFCVTLMLHSPQVLAQSDAGDASLSANSIVMSDSCAEVRELGPISLEVEGANGMLLSDLLQRLLTEAHQRGGDRVRGITLLSKNAGIVLLTGMLVGCVRVPTPPSPTTADMGKIVERLGPAAILILKNALSIEVLQYAADSRFETRARQLRPLKERTVGDPRIADPIVAKLLANEIHDYQTVRLCQTQPSYGVRFRAVSGEVLAILSVECPRLIWVQTNEGKEERVIPDELTSPEVARDLARAFDKLLVP